ncbi:MAG: DUF2723 domain-containing protein, partial [Ignavibacteriales bacterium]|nr:DUF2723 domain-containing protein [Ignavibacteriales bacterium]
FWAQSVAIEVYSLHLLFLMILLIAILKGVEETKVAASATSSYLLLFAFLLGLSFTNHLTTLLVLPACLFFYFRNFGFGKESLCRLGALVPFFSLGLFLYLFLPIRSAGGPAFDWGHPVTIQRIFWHISGKQYRNWIFSGFESAEKQLKHFVQSFPDQFHWICIALVGLGLWHLRREARMLFWFVMVLAIGCLAYSINYDIHDIDSYFLLAYLSAGIAIVFGLQSVHRLLSRNVHPWIVAGIIAVVPIGQYWMNRSAVDESDNFLVHDYTKTILENVATNAVVLTYQWDYFVSASYYFQRVRNERPDVTIIDKELLRRSWYFVQLERNDPWLIERSRSKVNSFLAELYKFEHDLPYDAHVIDARFNGMINDFIEQSMKDRPVYIGPEIEPFLTTGFERMPEGLLFRLQRSVPPATGGLPEIRYRPTAFQSRLTRGIRLQYAQMLTFCGIWLRNGGFEMEAKHALGLALEIDPSFNPARVLLGEEKGRGLGK